MGDKCEWEYNAKSETYETSCGRTWIVTETSLQYSDMIYCVFCGKLIDKEKS